ncbi:hypothetical protein [Palaeococcus ferrophilus]|uniref:hypothetical protein n=1 Tax=Palaeococcus ferrophilus TaxID=83868 RepID=UPI000A04ABA5|nr:hypothetical protein [Palaeococcus ferrophilus]
MKCPLCGFEFTEGSKACKGCPLAGSCSLVKCPNCGYEMVPEPRTLNSLKNTWRWIYGKVKGSPTTE